MLLLIPVIVALREPVAAKSAFERRRAIAAAQEEVLQRLDPAEFQLTARWHNIPGLAMSIDAAAIAQLQADPAVLRVDPDVGGSAAMAQSVPLIGGDRVHALG